LISPETGNLGNLVREGMLYAFLRRRAKR